jgi:prepilin-type processing-associated H-X9-DG protein
MRTFEERFTAWIDGRLSGMELAAFERELEAHPEALAETEADCRLGNLLRTHLSPPPLRNPDFFNLAILREIEASQPAPARLVHRVGFWSLPRMAFSGVCLLLVSTLLYFAAVPKTRREVQHNEQYVSGILNAQSDDPNITATAFHSKEGANVLWLDGFNYLPPDHKLK